MSGFIGFLAPPGQAPDAPLLEKLTAQLAFRGPDGRATKTIGGAALGQALLRHTFQCERDATPLSLDGNAFLIGDIRLDARDELREKIAGQLGVSTSHLPATLSDSRLLLHAYAAWGDDLVRHILGDFSFALWDAAQEKLLCARDHFGVAPFYYHQRDGEFAFSNTQRVLCEFPGVSREINERAIGDFLLIGCNCDLATTWFSDVASLPPAHRLIFQNGAARVERFWQPPERDDTSREYSRFYTRDAAQRKRVEEKIADEFGEILQRAVADRLRCERVVATLSGGMDSTAIVALAAKDIGENGANAAVDLRAESIGFNWLLPDTERYYAGLVAEKAGVPLRYYTAEPYILSEAGGWRDFFEPRFVGRSLPAWEIVEAAKTSDTRVLLGGYGGDPLLEFPLWHFADTMQRRQVKRLALDAFFFRRRRKRWPRRELGAALARRRGQELPLLPVPNIIDAEFAKRLNLEERWRALQNEIVETDARSGMALLPFWSNVLGSCDPDVSGLPVKVRHPFFDVRLLEFAQKTPPSPYFLDKRLLRLALRDWLPPEVLHRRKTPLSGSYFRELIRRGLDPEAARLSECEQLGPYVNRAALQENLRDHEISLRQNYDQAVVHPLTLAHWLRGREREKP